jgi:hypothetical protein
MPPNVTPLAVESLRKAMTLMTRLAKKPATIAATQHKIRSLAARLRVLSLIFHLSPLGIGAVANY